MRTESALQLFLLDAALGWISRSEQIDVAKRNIVLGL